VPSSSLNPAGFSYVEKIIIDNPVGHVGVVDFLDNNSRQLWIDGFEFGENDYLNIKNFGSNSSLYIRNDAKTQEALRHMAFEVDGQLRKAVLSTAATNCALPGSYYKVVASYEPWTPLPEPETYGALFLVSAIGLGLACRRKRGRRADLADSPEGARNVSAG